MCLSVECQPCVCVCKSVPLSENAEVIENCEFQCDGFPTPVSGLQRCQSAAQTVHRVGQCYARDGATRGDFPRKSGRVRFSRVFSDEQINNENSNNNSEYYEDMKCYI